MKCGAGGGARGEDGKGGESGRERSEAKDVGFICFGWGLPSINPSPFPESYSNRRIFAGDARRRATSPMNDGGSGIGDGTPTGLKSAARPGQSPPMLPALAVLVLAAAWRLFALYVPALSNFSPLMALAFCGGVYFRRGWVWLAPFVALTLSDLYIDRYYAVTYHYTWSASGAVIRTACFAAAVGLGVLVRAAGTGSASSAAPWPVRCSSTS